MPSLARHGLAMGVRGDEVPVTLPAHGTNLLVVGPSASGKSTLTGLLVERLADARRTFCLVDPEGDHQTLAELEGVVVLGGKTAEALPDRGELEQLVRRPDSSLVLNLSALSATEKIGYAIQALQVVAALRSARGLPHWLVVDEAHHVFPREGSAAAELLRARGESLCLITVEADTLAPAVLGARERALEAVRRRYTV